MQSSSRNACLDSQVLTRAEVTFLLDKISKEYDAVEQFMKTSNFETRLSHFIKEGKPMLQVMLIHIRVVVVMLQLIRAVRNGDWEGHLNALIAFVKFFFFFFFFFFFLPLIN